MGGIGDECKRVALAATLRDWVIQQAPRTDEGRAWWAGGGRRRNQAIPARTTEGQAAATTWIIVEKRLSLSCLYGLNQATISMYIDTNMMPITIWEAVPGKTKRRHAHRRNFLTSSAISNQKY